ncbi:MAG: hypothetical protein GIW94_13260 [Candidatus Eremiobacteraeota bacterium]|nr:hypothetical protein [Candidatus Eremiobacteraeota bacterium]
MALATIAVLETGCSNKARACPTARSETDNGMQGAIRVVNAPAAPQAFAP